jgi:hypothetical protein
VPPSLILCLRHAEKPSNAENPNEAPDESGPGFDGHGENPHSLTARGWARAWALAATNLCECLSHIDRPPAIFVPQHDGDPAQYRSYQTMLPLSQRLGAADIEQPCPKDRIDLLSEAVWTTEGVALVCWEHDKLADFVQTLVDSGDVAWPTGRFDLIWQLKSPSGVPYSCDPKNQALLAGDNGLC